jgi:WD40 repeat protein
MHRSRTEFTATLLQDGQVLVVGGGGGDGIQASAELFNPQTGKWTLTGSMHTPRLYHTATLLPDGRVLVTGGASGGCDSTSACSDVLSSAELYDPRTGTWTMTGHMRQARYRQTATLLPNGQVLVAGGQLTFVSGGNVTTMRSSAELYNPRTGAWAPTHSMHTAAGNRSATLLSSGLVLVAGGGGNNFSLLTSTELYHPRTGTWTITGSLHDGRYYQTGQSATLLGSGKVLVAGGNLVIGGSPVASAELYDPRTGSWTLTGSLHQPCAFQPATLLPSGQVLIAGGSLTNDGSIAIATAELYHP